uniref:Uncharacterized protein n=1 Tax=Aegilops tauschii subsp. strangulata TaxID=200361 RepID=A0A453FRX5_AEGTS
MQDIHPQTPQQHLEPVHLQQIGAPLHQRLGREPERPIERTRDKGFGLLPANVTPASPVAGGLDDDQGRALQPQAAGQLEVGGVLELHAARRDLRPVGARRGRQPALPELRELLRPHAQRPLPVGVRQHQASQRRMLLDDRPEQVVPRRRGDQGADGPHHAQLQPAVGVEGLRHAPAVLRRRRLVPAGGLAVDQGAAQDDAALERAAVPGPPLEQNPLLRPDVPRGELHPEVADVGEAPEHLHGRVLGEPREQRPAARAARAAHALERLGDGEEHELEEVGEDVAGLGGRQVERVVGVAVHGHHAVDLDVHVVDERDQVVEAPGHGGAAAQRVHVLQLVEDEQHERVRQAVDPVRLRCRRVRVDASLGMHFSDSGLLRTNQQSVVCCSRKR